MNTFVEIPASKMSIAKRTTIFGIGINDACYQVQPFINGKQVTCPFYRVWKNMMKRCYSKKLQEMYQTYAGCTVCEEWLTFSNFKNWMIKQDFENRSLDKDVINPGNKIYSPDNCVFVTVSINSLLTNCKAGRGEYPQGVSYFKATGYFRSNCNVNGKQRHLGYFNTSEEASNAYKKFKSEHIASIANKQSDIRIKNGLLRHAEFINL